MKRGIIITGTDTGIGKTIFAAGFVSLLGGAYWKPIQSGCEEETDSQTVARLARLPSTRIVPEAYCFSTSVSPHWAAEIDGVVLDTDHLVLPQITYTLVIETAGGLMVPFNRRTKFIDLFEKWGLPVILCARTSLGTINHTLLSIEALRRRSIPLLGIAFIGNEVANTQRTISEFGNVPILGRLPYLNPLTFESLQEAMKIGFDFSCISGIVC